MTQLTRFGRMTVRRVRRVGTTTTTPAASHPGSRPFGGGGVARRGDEGAEWAQNDCGGEPINSDSAGSDGKVQDAGPSLSERLQMEQQQQQKQQRRHKGPLLDSDHSALSGSATSRQRKPSTISPAKKSSGESIESGWSWDSSSRTNSEGWSWASSAKSGGGSLRGKRKMKAALGAFGGEGAIREKVLRAVNCRNGRGGAEKQSPLKQQPSEKAGGVARALKVGLVVLLALWGVFQIGRRRGRRMESSSSHSMSDLYLRGQLPSSESSPNLAADSAQQSKSHDGNTIVHQAYFPPQLAHLANLTAPYDAKKETPYFWDVHFSGESVAEAVFAQCHGLVQACEFGLRQPDYDEDKLGVFQLEGAKYANVDLTTKEGIERASRLELASSGVADVIISPHFNDVASRIFTPSDQGRMFALFRHPVDRALGMYYYLQKASWDPQYNPDLAKMSIEEYAKSKYIESNWLTRFLVGKTRGKLTHSDMLLAKKIIKFKCLVGLYDDMEVSLARFQRYFGWDSSDDRKAEVAKCRSAAVLQGDKHVLGHPISLKEGQEHLMPKLGSAVRAGSVAWDAIVRMNAFDMELYAYAKKTYRLQAEAIFDVVGHEVPEVASLGAGVAGDGAEGSGLSVSVVEDSFDDRASSPQSGKHMAAALEMEEAKASTLHSHDGNVAADSEDQEESFHLEEATARRPSNGVGAADSEAKEESSDLDGAHDLHPRDGVESAESEVKEKPSPDPDEDELDS